MPGIDGLLVWYVPLTNSGDKLKVYTRMKCTNKIYTRMKCTNKISMVVFGHSYN